MGLAQEEVIVSFAISIPYTSFVFIVENGVRKCLIQLNPKGGLGKVK